MTPLTNFIWRRLDDMWRHPAMWATTREGFGMQVVQLIEVACVAGLLRDDRRAIDHLKFEIFSENPQTKPLRMNEVPTEDWAKMTVEIGRGFLHEYMLKETLP